jgi:hypothetical protein
MASRPPHNLGSAALESRGEEAPMPLSSTALPAVSLTVPADTAALALERLRQLGPFFVLYRRAQVALERAARSPAGPREVRIALPAEDLHRFVEWLALELGEIGRRGDTRPRRPRGGTAREPAE